MMRAMTTVNDDDPEDRPGISNQVKLRRVTFGEDGTMTWGEPPADSDRDDSAKDGEWKFVQRFSSTPWRKPAYGYFEVRSSVARSHHLRTCAVIVDGVL